MNKIVFHKSAPKKCYLAFSGGVDSIVLLHLLLEKNVDVTLLWINHYTTWCDNEMAFAIKAAANLDLNLEVRHIDKYDKSTSLECFWSQQRSKIYNSMDMPVLTGHHLDDAVEWYVMSTLQGQPKVMCAENKNVIRPLLCIHKRRIIDYAIQHNLAYLTDPTNSNTSFNLRNKVRINLIPEILKCFPGIHTTVRKAIIKKDSLYLSLCD